MGDPCCKKGKTQQGASVYKACDTLLKEMRYWADEEIQRISCDVPFSVTET
jgi:hypothetical protein